MKPVHQILFAAGLLIIGAITWLILTLPKPQASWLTVDAPVRAAPGETITLRVKLTNPDQNLQLNADLHGTTHRSRPLRVVSAGQPQRVGASTGGLDFRLTLPTQPDLSSVHAIIYLTSTGGWSDRIRVAKSDPISIESSPPHDRKLRPLPAHDHRSDPVVPRFERAGLRFLIASLWLVAASVLTLRRKRVSHEHSGEPHTRVAGLIAACAGIALAELLHFESFVGDAARQLAFKYGFYDERLLPQQLAILFLVLGVTALAVFIVLRARNRRFVLGLLLHGAIAFAAILSLHEVDAMLYATAFGFPLEQLAKLAAVSFSLWGLKTPIARRIA